MLCPIAVTFHHFADLYLNTLASSCSISDRHWSSCSSLWTAHQEFWSGATRDAAFRRVKEHAYLVAVLSSTSVQVRIIAATAAAILVGIVAVGWLLSLLSPSSLLVGNVFVWWDFIRVCLTVLVAPYGRSHFPRCNTVHESIPRQSRSYCLILTSFFCDPEWDPVAENTSFFGWWTSILAYGTCLSCRRGLLGP